MSAREPESAGDAQRRISVAILLFDRLTALDAVGPYEALTAVPTIDVSFVAEQPGRIETEGGPLVLEAQHGLDELTAPDVVLVPGGAGTRELLDHDPILEWLRAAHRASRWTTSVCTGSLLLGAAGILEGLRATGHWMFLEPLRDYAAEPSSERVVVEREARVITAAGVSSGIDMALRLIEELTTREVAEAVQLGIEYDPQPHIDAGSPEKAAPEIVELVRAAASD